MKKRSLTPILQGYKPVSYVWHSPWGGGGRGGAGAGGMSRQVEILPTCNLRSENSAT